jgi:hypothetical protein
MRTRTTGKPRRCRSTARWGCRILIAAAAPFAAPAPAGGDEEASQLEYRIKAAAIYRLALFVEWPEGSFESDASPLVLGILGEDPFGEILERTFEGKRVHGRRIQIRRGAALDDIGGAQVVFVSASEKEGIGKIIQKIDGSRVLMLSDLDGFAEQGGHFSLPLIDNKVRLKMNVDLAKRTKLKFDAQIWKITIHVRESARSAPGERR